MEMFWVSLISIAMGYTAAGCTVTMIDAWIERSRNEHGLESDPWEVLKDIGSWPATVLKWIVHTFQGRPL